MVYFKAKHVCIIWTPFNQSSCRLQRSYCFKRQHIVHENGPIIYDVNVNECVQHESRYIKVWTKIERLWYKVSNDVK